MSLIAVTIIATINVGAKRREPWYKWERSYDTEWWPSNIGSTVSLNNRFNENVTFFTWRSSDFRVLDEHELRCLDKALEFFKRSSVLFISLFGWLVAIANSHIRYYSAQYPSGKIHQKLAGQSFSSFRQTLRTSRQWLQLPAQTVTPFNHNYVDYSSTVEAQWTCACSSTVAL